MRANLNQSLNFNIFLYLIRYNLTMQWSVEFYKTQENSSPVEEWLDSIPTTARAKMLRNMFLLEEFGFSLKEPYVKPLKDKLYEVRAKDNRGIYRVVYFAFKDKRLVMLHGFTKKTQKTPPSEIAVAKKRMKDFINE